MKSKEILNIEYESILNTVTKIAKIEEKILYLEKILFFVRINKKNIENYKPCFEKKIKKQIAYLNTILNK